MSGKLSFIVILTCLFTVIFALPFGSSLASGKCTEDEIKKMNFPKERIAMICDIPVEQVVLVQKKKAEENEPTNTGLTAKQNRWGPIVKGLQLGMPYNEAIAALTRRSGDNIHINPRITSSGNVDIFLKDKTGKDYLSRISSKPGKYEREYHARFGKPDSRSAGSLFINDSGIVRSINFNTRLVNALFNAYKVTTSDFVKAFAEHYSIKEWHQKIKRTDFDSEMHSLASEFGMPPPPSDVTLGSMTQEVWTFQGDGFTIEVYRVISLSNFSNLPGMKDEKDYETVRDKNLILTIKTPEATETPSDSMTFD